MQMSPPISTMLRLISVFYLLLWYLVTADVPEASTKNCDLLDPEHQQTLREQLKEDSCLREVEGVEPHEVKRAARLFHRDGFVVVNNVLPEAQTAKLKVACDQLIEQVLEKDPFRLGNRGPYRWSLSAASKTGHLLHVPEFANLIDLPTITPILKEIFGNDKYIARGSRGDFNLPGAVWQDLHADVWKEWLIDPAPTEFSDSGRLNYRDLPIFYVVVNFNVINITAFNAPIRQIPMTQHSQQPIPQLDDEPLWMKRSTVCPVAAGTAIIRDPRAWHGGTPNLSNETRCMPNVEYYASWYRFRDHTQQMTTSMPREIYEKLSEFGKKLSQEVVAAPGEAIETSVKDKPYLLYSNHRECYKKMGLSDQDLEEYTAQGVYIPSLRHVPGFKFEEQSSFYQRKKESNVRVQNDKDEL